MNGDRAGVPGQGDHRAYDELAVGWALHALEPEDEAVFAQHLPGCARCARTVAETEDVLAAMATDLPPAEPSEELRARLRSAVAETEQIRRPGTPEASADEVAGGEPAARRPGFPASEPVRSLDSGRGAAWRRRWPTALAAAAVAAIVGLGTWNVVLASSRDELQATAAEQAEIMESVLRPGRATIAPVSGDDGQAVATVVARDGEVQVVTHGLSRNDRASSTYVVWGMRDTTPVALGTFDVVDSDMDLRSVGSDQTGLSDFSTYGISIEPGRQAPSSPTEIVATGQVTS